MDAQFIKLAENTLLILDKKSWNSINIDEIYKKTKISKKNFKIKLLTNVIF